MISVNVNPHIYKIIADILGRVAVRGGHEIVIDSAFFHCRPKGFKCFGVIDRHDVFSLKQVDILEFQG